MFMMHGETIRSMMKTALNYCLQAIIQAILTPSAIEVIIGIESLVAFQHSLTAGAGAQYGKGHNLNNARKKYKANYSKDNKRNFENLKRIKRKNAFKAMKPDSFDVIMKYLEIVSDIILSNI